jgi:hypothetical protein
MPSCRACWITTAARSRQPNHRSVPCHDLPQDPPVRDHHPGQLTGYATQYRLNLRTASCHRRRRVTCRPSPLPRSVRQRSKLPGPGLAPGGEPPGRGTGDRRALPARGPPHTRRCRPAGRDPLAPAQPAEPAARRPRSSLTPRRSRTQRTGCRPARQVLTHAGVLVALALIQRSSR